MSEGLDSRCFSGNATIQNEQLARLALEPPAIFCDHQVGLRYRELIGSSGLLYGSRERGKLDSFNQVLPCTIYNAFVWFADVALLIGRSYEEI